MARIRTLKPEFFQDESLASCSPHARLLAIALLQLCDRQGVFRNIPMQVHAHAFPWEATVKVQALLGELQAAGYVSFYRVAGREYGFIPGFARHQSIGGKEAQAPGRYPLPDQADASWEGDDMSPGSTQTLPREAKGTAGKGKGTRKGKGGEAVASRLPPEWQPSEANVDYCRKTRPDLDPSVLAEDFRDYWLAQGGARARKADWDRTWNRWVREEKHETSARAARPALRPTVEDKLAHLRRMSGEAEGGEGVDPADRDVRGPLLAGVRR